MAKTVAWVTCARFPQGFEREAGCQEQLRAAGHQVIPWIWDAPAPADFDLVVVRSPWDYHLKAQEWLDWIESVPGRVLNPAATLAWNSDKRYLLDLERRGVPIVPTLLARAGEPFALLAELQSRGWAHAVVKPAISASAHLTWRTNGDQEERFQAQLALADQLIQPFLPEVMDEGEWSLVYLDREFSHAVRKRPAPGDFRSQEEHGAHVELVAVPAALREQASAVLDHVDGQLLYGRVDGIWREGHFLLMELELVDPTLYFEHHPPAQQALTRLILQELA